MSKIQITNFILLVTTFIMLSIFFQINKQQLINQLNNWRLLPEPESYTELYFNNGSSLPSKIGLRTKPKFSFVIHNEENKTTTYVYEVLLVNPRGKSIISKKSISLYQGQYITINEAFSVNNPIKREEVIVKLVNFNQQIDFWIGVNK